MQEEKGVKIGARVLDDDTLRILIPDYESIFSEIEKIRGNITSVETQGESKTGLIKPPDDEFFKHHNNIFSILGERGAGKTSVQLTLKYKLGQIDEVINSDKTEEKDVVKHVAKDVDTILPIIVPQDMDDDSSVIGWIIAHFSNIIKDLFKVEERCYYFNEKDEEKIKKLKARFEDLKKSYFLRQDTYKSSLSVEDTIHNYVQKNEEVIRENIDLSKKFKVFIDEFIEFRKNNKKTNPLIFIFFDDVDISNKRCLMVLETLLRYLSHSNIVVFVAGDYLTFKETITLSYLKEDGLLDKELMVQTFEKKSALEIRQTLAYDYLKKVLSPALRYELKTLSLENKKAFKCKKDSLSLEELLKEKVRFLDPFYEIFDSKPRGLINVYYFLRSIQTSSMSNDELRRFIATLINSSSDLNTKKEEIEEIIEFNPNIDINFSKFKKTDYSSVNLKILILILFADKDEKIKEYEKEILEYFKNYLDEKIEIIGEVRRKNDIFDVFLEGKDIHENLDLFYNLLIKFEGKKISQSKFYQKYFSQILRMNNNNANLEMNKYYSTHLYLNKDKIRKIGVGLKQVTDTIDTNLLIEMEGRFKNLYLLDEWRESLNYQLKNKKTISFQALKRKYTDILPLTESRIKYFKKTMDLLINVQPIEEDIYIQTLSVNEKMLQMIKKIEKIKLIIIEIFEYIKQNSDIVSEVYNGRTFGNIDYSNKNKLFTETVNGYKNIYQLKLILNECHEISFQNLDEIILKLKDLEIYQNIIKEIDENLNEMKDLQLKIQQNQFENIDRELSGMGNKLDKDLEEVLGKNIQRELRVMKQEFLRHLSAQNLLNGFLKRVNQKIYDKSLNEVLDKLREMYKKIECYRILNKIERESEALEEISDCLLDLEEKFIKNKIIIEIKNKKVLEVLKDEELLEFEGYLNSENYVNSKELKERYDIYYRWDDKVGVSEWRDLVYEYVKKELRSHNINLLQTERIELENLIEIFIYIYRIIEKNKNKERDSSEIEPKRFEELYKNLSQEPLLKRYF